MKFSCSNSALLGPFVVSLRIFRSLSASTSGPLVLDSLRNTSLSNSSLLSADDPRFSILLSFDETDLPVTPVLMNAVELIAQYAERDFHSQVHGRHGKVLQTYPQIEIAVLAAERATTMEVRFVIWAIYGGIVEISARTMFKQADIAFSWDDIPMGNVYITRPLDELPDPGTLTPQPVKDSTSLTVPIGRFTWLPYFKPAAQNVPAKDIFILILGAIKVIAEYPIGDKIPGALHVNNIFADAHIEVYLQERRTPRTTWPFFQYGHLLEALKQIPAWMLEKRRFAEMLSIISSMGLRVGQVLLLHGRFDPNRFDGVAGSVSVG